jgi:hypothetical protein
MRAYGGFVQSKCSASQGVGWDFTLESFPLPLRHKLAVSAFGFKSQLKPPDGFAGSPQSLQKQICGQWFSFYPVTLAREIV